jgi:hypothetical protein
MFIKKYHRLIGIFMLLPLCLWAMTGAFFIIKPGYEGAYQKLNIRSYPIQQQIVLPESLQWHTIKKTRSILGEHILVKTPQQWQQLNTRTFQLRPLPSKEQIKLLIGDATNQDKTRYGEILSIDTQQNTATAVTSTGVNIQLDWNSLVLSQRGDDTEFISTLYKLHYLQWTGNAIIDSLLEIIVLSGLTLLTLMGGWMSIKK